MFCQIIIHFPLSNWGFRGSQSHSLKEFKEAELGSYIIILITGRGCFPGQWQSALKVWLSFSPANFKLLRSITNHIWCFISISTRENYLRLCFVMVISHFSFKFYLFSFERGRKKETADRLTPISWFTLPTPRVKPGQRQELRTQSKCSHMDEPSPYLSHHLLPSNICFSWKLESVVRARTEAKGLQTGCRCINWHLTW